MAAALSPLCPRVPIPHTAPPSRANEAILVLGAGLKGGHRIGPGLRSRLETALELSRERPDAVLILSGGGAGLLRESHAMAHWLLEHGVDPARIVLEERSNNTRGNMRESVPLLAALGVRSVRLVTEAFHMKRSRLLLDMVLRQSGLGDVELIAAPAPTRNLEAAQREHPVPYRDLRAQTHAWREAPRLQIDGRVVPPRGVIQGAAAAFTRSGSQALILPSSE